MTSSVLPRSDITSGVISAHPSAGGSMMNVGSMNMEARKA